MSTQPTLSHRAPTYAFFQGEHHKVSNPCCSQGSKCRIVKGCARMPTRAERVWFLVPVNENRLSACLPPPSPRVQ